MCWRCSPNGSRRSSAFAGCACITRLPIVIPQRVDDSLVGWLKERAGALDGGAYQSSAEVDGAVEQALGKMVDAGIPVLNQSVLLRE